SWARLEPCLLPENQTSRFAPPMSSPVTARFEVQCVGNATSPNREHGVAGLVCSLVDLESFPAKREHLGHERHSVVFCIAIEGSENLLLAPNLDPVADLQSLALPHAL